MAAVRTSSRTVCWLSLAVLVGPACDGPTEPAYVPLLERALAVAPAGVALSGVGATASFALEDSTGAPVPADSVTWFSLEPAIATIDSATGRVTAVAAGQVAMGARIDTTVVGYGTVNVSVSAARVTAWSADTLARPYLYGVWGRAADDVFVVGERMLVYHYDGDIWRPMDNGLARRAFLFDVSGTAAGPVFTVGRNGVHAWDGESWTHAERLTEFLAVWAVDPGTAFALDDTGQLWRYDGSGWSFMAGGAPGGESLWASGPNDVFAGASQSIVHYDGTDWTRVVTGLSGMLRTIWGSGPDDVYAGGDFGGIHYDGVSWSLVQDLGIRALSGDTASGTVWAAGYSRFMRFDGTEWTLEDEFAAYHIVDLWAASADTVFAVGGGGALAVRTDQGWSWSRIGAGPTQVTGLWMPTPDRLFVAQSQPEDLLESTPGGLTGICTPGSGAFPLRGIWGLSANQFTAVGGSTVVQVRNRVCTYEDLFDDQGQLNAVWTAAPDDAWAVGAAVLDWEPPVALRYNGHSWRRFQVTSLGRAALFAVWGSARDDVWIAGGNSDGGLIGHYDGVSWTGQSIPQGDTLRGLWGTSSTDVFAVGDGGRILHFDGTGWTAMDTPVTADLEAVAGTAPDNVYAAGGGVVLHYDGSQWVRLHDAPDALYLAIAASSAGPVYFGADGLLVTATP